MKHFAQFHQHTTFQEEEEENHGNERRREEEGEHEREAVIAHDLPQSTVDAHLDETDEENRSSGSETTMTTTTSAERNEDPVATITAATGNKPHLARGWLVSKLPFDVDQPGSERTALEANFNGSVPLLTHRGIFKYDPTPRVDGMND